jgi:two-component system response regulator RegA
VIEGMSGRDILLADDHRAFRSRLARALRRLGYNVLTSPASPRAIRLARASAVRYAAVDVQTPRGGGLDLVATLRQELPGVRIVALVGNGAVNDALDAMGRGAHFYLTEPFDVGDVFTAMTGARLDGARLSWSASLARLEWEHVQRTLLRCEGNVSETARRLGITRRAMQLKLKRGPPS